MADETPMSQEQIAELMRTMGSSQPAMPPNNPLKDAEVMRKHLAAYTAERAFVPGDVVRQIVGLCIQQRQFQPLAYIYVKPLEKAIEVNGPHYHNLDCVLGHPDAEGDLQFVLADSHRFEIYPEEDLQRLGAEASKAIN